MTKDLNMKNQSKNRLYLIAALTCAIFGGAANHYSICNAQTTNDATTTKITSENLEEEDFGESKDDYFTLQARQPSYSNGYRQGGGNPFVSWGLSMIPYAGGIASSVYDAATSGDPLTALGSYGLGFIPGVGGGLAQTAWEGYRTGDMIGAFAGYGLGWIGGSSPVKYHNNWNIDPATGALTGLNAANIWRTTGATGVQAIRQGMNQSFATTVTPRNENAASISGAAIGSRLSLYETGALLAILDLRYSYSSLLNPSEREETERNAFLKVCAPNFLDASNIICRYVGSRNGYGFTGSKLRMEAFFLAAEKKDKNAFLIASYLNGLDLSSLNGNMFAAMTLEYYGLRLLKNDDQTYQTLGKQILEQAQKLVPNEKNDKWRLFCAAQTLLAGLKERAYQLFEELEKSELNDEDKNLLNELLCRALLLDERYDEAQLYLDAILQQEPSDSDSLLQKLLYAESIANQGLILFFKDRDEEAEAKFNVAAKLLDKQIAQYSKPSSEKDIKLIEWANEKRYALDCRRIQVACRAQNYEFALDLWEKATSQKIKLLSTWQRTPEEVRKRFGSHPLFKDAYYEGNQEKRDEKWQPIYGSFFLFEKNLRIALEYKRGNYDEALRWLQNTLELQEKLKMEDSAYFAETLRYRALISRTKATLESLLQAREDIKRARSIASITLFEQGILACDAADVEREIAALDPEQGNLDQAESDYETCENIFTQLNVADSRFVDLYFGRAMLKRMQSNTEEAYQDMELAIERSLDVRASCSVNAKDQAVRFSQFYYLFETKAGWLLEDWNAGLGNKREIEKELFNVFETSRAHSFMDLADEARVDWIRDVPKEKLEDMQKSADELYQTEKRYEKEYVKWVEEVRAKDAQITNTSMPENLLKLNADVQEKRKEYLAAENAVKSASVIRKELLNVKRKPCDFVNFVESLKNEETMACEYLVGEKHSYLMVYGAIDDTRVYELTIDDLTASVLRDALQREVESGPLTAELLSSIMKVFLQRAQDTYDSQQQERFVDVSYALWKILFPEQICQKLTSKDDNVVNLLVIPEGILSQVPFESLAVKEWNDDEPRYLLDENPVVVYAPSGSIYNDFQSDSSGSNATSLLTAGNPNYSDSTRKLPELSGTEEEVKLVAASYENIIDDKSILELLQNDATERNVVKGIDKKYVHLACHGLCSFERGQWKGALALTPGSQKDAGDDGNLTLGEIFKLNMQSCNLVILSACKTNIGDSQQGEGTWSLSRGFLVSGARSVVASNWNVDDESTASLISSFMQEVLEQDVQGDNHSYARALKNAKLNLKRNQFSEPYYWAPFVMLGQR